MKAIAQLKIINTSACQWVPPFSCQFAQERDHSEILHNGGSTKKQKEGGKKVFSSPFPLKQQVLFNFA